MGYTIKIGNAKPSFDESDFPYLMANWEVEDCELPDAPNFPNDINNNKNERWPSYSVWDDFTKKTGLYKFFYGKYKRVDGIEIESDGLFEAAGHPGCIGITKENADFVTEALDKYKAQATLPPGFEVYDEHFHDCEKEGCKLNYDCHLARLIWLEWWMQWAVKNCEIPAIENS
jgi:hypothetical protein